MFRNPKSRESSPRVKLLGKPSALAGSLYPLVRHAFSRNSLSAHAYSLLRFLSLCFYTIQLFCKHLSSKHTITSQKVPGSRKTPAVRNRSLLKSIFTSNHLTISYYNWPKDLEKEKFQLEIKLVKVKKYRIERGRSTPHHGTPRFVAPANAKRE